MPKPFEGGSTQTFRKLYGFKNIIAWQKANDLAVMVHALTREWGAGYYRLSDQMRSAAVSIESNIAEGYCRVSLGDYIRFCEIARGSAGELGSQIQDCERWGLASGPQLAELLEQYGDATFFLEKLSEGLKKKQKAGDWDKSFGTREEAAEYLQADAEYPFELPDSGEGEEARGNSELKGAPGA